MVYLFSGLGADESIFRFLELKIPAQVIRWMAPQPSENLEGYARRIVTEQITEPHGAVLIGVSFGGIVAGEVARLLKPAKLLLISSLKNSGELPFYYRWAGKLRLDVLIPAQFMIHPTFFTYYSFGVSNQRDKALLKEILQNTDKVFLKWAIRQILTWKSLQKIENLVHIHGGNDHILPCRYVKNAITVENGGHLMIISQAKKISELIQRYLN